MLWSMSLRALDVIGFADYLLEWGRFDSLRTVSQNPPSFPMRRPLA